MYLVTGATGHIGNNLIRTLLDQDPQCEIRAFVLPDFDLASLKSLPIEIMYGNILDPDSLAQAMQDVDVVFHLAGIIAIRSEQSNLIENVNVQGSVNVAKAALKAGVRRIVHVASIHIFERIPAGIIDENVPLVTRSNAAGIYDYSKAEAVRHVQTYVNDGLDVVFACPTGVIGPNDYLGSEIGVVLKQYLTQSIHAIVDGGYDWVDARDVAAGLIDLAKNGVTGELYILGGHYISMKEFAMRAAQVLNRTITTFHVPYPIVFLTAHFLRLVSYIFKTKPIITPYALKTIRDNANISHQKATDAIGFVPRPIEETFYDTLRWYQENESAHEG